MATHLSSYYSGTSRTLFYYSNMSHSNRRPIRVLAAVSQGALPLLSKALGTDFNLIFCPSIAAARVSLNDAIDVIVAGISFDEGQMFNLLRQCKSCNHAKRIAFVCIRCSDDEEGKSHEAFDLDTRSLGGDGFIDLYRWSKQFGTDQAYEELRNLIDTHVQFRRAQDQHNPGFYRI